MIPLAALACGFGVGWLRAARRGGKTADKWQYAIGHAIGFAILAFFITLVLVRFHILPSFPLD